MSVHGPGCWACGWDAFWFGHAPDCYDGLVPDYDDWDQFFWWVANEFAFQPLAIDVAWENVLRELV